MKFANLQRTIEESQDRENTLFLDENTDEDGYSDYGDSDMESEYSY